MISSQDAFPIQERRIVAVVDDTAILAQADSTIEPGHQRLLISNTPLGRALVMAFASISPEPDPDGYLCIAHDYQVDEHLVLLINLAAHIRMTAPDMMQLTLSLE
jgi:hypothetical protein